jgi:cation:H+ antiporter
MDFLALIAGLAGLWLGTDITIRGAVSISKRLGISEFVVGVAILSIGSDLPELAVAVDGALIILRGGQASEVVVGSALGSSLGQIGFVLGLAGLFGILTLPRKIVISHGSVLLGTLVLLGFLGYDGNVSRWEGALLVVAYLVYLGFLLSDKESWEGKTHSGSILPLTTTWLFMAIGLGVVIVSAELTVSAVSSVARALDISESIIAIVVIGLGTSLPELSISVGAVIRRRNRMSVGNLIGSNVFDTLVPIGVAAAISGIRFDSTMLTRDLPFLFALSLLVLIFFWRKKGIQKYQAAMILGAYCAYVVIRFSVI